MIHRLCIAAVVGMGLVGCDDDPLTAKLRADQAAAEAKRLENPWNVPSGPDVQIWSDPETHCQYLLRRIYLGDSITPRLNADGKPMCGAP